MSASFGLAAPPVFTSASTCRNICWRTTLWTTSEGAARHRRRVPSGDALKSVGAVIAIAVELGANCSTFAGIVTFFAMSSVVPLVLPPMTAATLSSSTRCLPARTRSIAGSPGPPSAPASPARFASSQATYASVRAGLHASGSGMPPLALISLIASSMLLMRVVPDVAFEPF